MVPNIDISSLKEKPIDVESGENDYVKIKSVEKQGCNKDEQECYYKIIFDNEEEIKINSDNFPMI